MNSGNDAGESGNTIVTICDNGSVWGAWLLAGSMVRCGMTEELLIGYRGLSSIWEKKLAAFANVTLLPLPENPGMELCDKIYLMLAAKTEFVTWMNCDTLFLENCRDWLTGDKEEIYCFSFSDEREENGSCCSVPDCVLQTWQRDVDERAIPARATPFSPRVIGIHRDNRAFLERWRQLTLETARRRAVLPTLWKPFFRSLDNDMFNALLLFGENIPPVSERFRLVDVRNERYLSFPRSVKPWQRWISSTRPQAPRVWELVCWLSEAGYASGLELPRALRPANTLWQRLMLSIA